MQLLPPATQAQFRKEFYSQIGIRLSPLLGCSVHAAIVADSPRRSWATVRDQTSRSSISNGAVSSGAIEGKPF